MRVWTCVIVKKNALGLSIGCGHIQVISQTLMLITKFGQMVDADCSTVTFRARVRTSTQLTQRDMAWCHFTRMPNQMDANELRSGMLTRRIRIDASWIYSGIGLLILMLRQGMRSI